MPPTNHGGAVAGPAAAAVMVSHMGQPMHHHLMGGQEANHPFALPLSHPSQGQQGLLVHPMRVAPKPDMNADNRKRRNPPTATKPDVR